MPSWRWWVERLIAVAAAGSGIAAYAKFVHEPTPTPPPVPTTPVPVPDSTPTPVPPVPPPAPGPKVCHECLEAGCKRAVIAFGARVEEFIAPATRARLNDVAYCAEVHEYKDRPGYFTLSLGRLKDNELRGALDYFRKDGIWQLNDIMSVGLEHFGARVYPPPCVPGTVHSVERAGACGDDPPSNAETAADGTKFEWMREGLACSCQANNSWIKNWEEYSDCFQGCMGDAQCRAQCVKPGRSR